MRPHVSNRFTRGKAKASNQMQSRPLCRPDYASVGWCVSPLRRPASAASSLPCTRSSWHTQPHRNRSACSVSSACSPHLTVHVEVTSTRTILCARHPTRASPDPIVPAENPTRGDHPRRANESEQTRAAYAADPRCWYTVQAGPG